MILTENVLPNIWIWSFVRINVVFLGCFSNQRQNPLWLSCCWFLCDNFPVIFFLQVMPYQTKCFFKDSIEVEKESKILLKNFMMKFSMKSMKNLYLVLIKLRILVNFFIKVDEIFNWEVDRSCAFYEMCD